MSKNIFYDNAVLMIDLLGGKDNIKEIQHCATRLRFILKDDTKFDLEKVKKHPLFKGYKKQESQHQIIIGTGVVDKLYKQINLILKDDLQEGEIKVENKEPFWRKDVSVKSNLFMISKRGMNSFASIFVPLIPIFIAGGMSLALKSLIGSFAPNSGFTKLLDIIGGAILGSLPAFVGYTAAKKWGGNPYLGMAMGLVLISPGLLNSYAINTPVLLGFDLNTSSDVIQSAREAAFKQWLESNGFTESQIPTDPGQYNELLNKTVGAYYYIFGNVAGGFFKIKLIEYQAQIIPVLLVLALSVNLERLLKKITPNVIAIIVVPLVTVLVSSWLAFWLIGPLGQIIGKGISIELAGMFKYTNWNFIGFGGLVFAFFYPFLVITGLHQGFLPIETQLLVDTQLKYGHSFSFITPIACVSNIAQGSATLMLIFFCKKDKEQITKASSGTIGAFTGITEPAMFGVNLQIKPLFLSAAIGSGIAGWWLGMTHTVANSLGSASWIGLVQFDWTTQATQNYFAKENINAVFQSIPMGAHIAIAMLISMGATVGVSTILLKTKWGKKSLENYLK
ncbi:PTS transporter subunit EIIC [Spiroplasma floricola]|uniref:PTS system, sucrose-specific IIABC component n=1 Tax=Spiroplasma floricola 23-6 TaxID=1336749 RepID=A0A2K8SDQ3_9MOLU|nr:PTS transporter subunit EIIC [Spiroplasma floricola]AUB31581.1 PTS system, sucrose-specific IIABC component [Spiroplasma floricola 23-6]